MKNTAFTFSLCLVAILLLGGGAIQAAQLNSTSTLVDEGDLTSPPSKGKSPQFAGVIDDLPLMDGLEPVREGDVLFVVPRSGRIAETVATGIVDVDEVYNFYRKTLPHLGWKRIDGRSYQRENEILRIEARAEGKVTTVRFSVKPVSERP